MAIRADRDNIVEVLVGNTWIDVDPGTFEVDREGGFSFIDGDNLSCRIVGQYAAIRAVREMRDI